jgi:hypothetical protein
MAFGPIRTVLIGWLLLMAAACASTRMSTRDIYSELAFSGGIVCTPVSDGNREQRQDGRFHDRMVALRSWLIAEIGQAELARMQSEYDEEMASVSFTFQCPSAQEHSHRRTRRWMLLHELETRARARPIEPMTNLHEERGGRQ